MNESEAPALIAIAGGSGAGKTTLAEALAHVLEDAVVLSMDRYYRDLSQLPAWERAAVNFDHPDAIEFDLLERHLGALLAGSPIAAPVYHFHAHRRAAATDDIESRAFVILEGLHALHHERVRALCGRRVFVDTPVEVCLNRRIDRDTAERGRTEAFVRTQFETSTLPMYREYVAPTRTWADVIVDGSESIGTIVERVLPELFSGETAS